LSGTSTASNYARDWQKCQAVRPELAEQGPYLHKPDLRIPSFVLTKTHCTGYCDVCPPSQYVVDADAFKLGCCSGSKKDNDGSIIETVYDSSVPVKAVHLIRNPFDNIVSRMHLALKRRSKQGWTDEDLAIFKTNDKASLDAWCSYMDEKFVADEAETDLIDDETKQLFRQVPCHADWFRYVQWHNLAIEVVDRLDLPVHILHYENYTTDYNTTVDGLFEFMALERQSNPVDFSSNKTYVSFYSSDTALAAMRLVRSLASNKTWDLVEHYFEPWKLVSN